MFFAVFFLADTEFSCQAQLKKTLDVTVECHLAKCHNLDPYTRIGMTQDSMMTVGSISNDHGRSQVVHMQRRLHARALLIHSSTHF